MPSVKSDNIVRWGRSSWLLELSFTKSSRGQGADRSAVAKSPHYLLTWKVVKEKRR